MLGKFYFLLSRSMGSQCLSVKDGSSALELWCVLRAFLNTLPYFLQERNYYKIKALERWLFIIHKSLWSLSLKSGHRRTSFGSKRIRCCPKVFRVVRRVGMKYMAVWKLCPRCCLLPSSEEQTVHLAVSQMCFDEWTESVFTPLFRKYYSGKSPTMEPGTERNWEKENPNFLFVC